ncbi:interleukin-18 receptor 1-like isoform X3 [Heterodontus francisci]|uniref:interleukin-18 receptor 1-like isoform X3 n=1 Tax=Heterodontus francisci TaxID=7792 RepID=UPI00355B1FEC
MIIMLWMFLLTFIISEVMNGYSTKGNQIDRCPPDVSTTVFALEGEHAHLRCRLCNASTPLAMNDLQMHGFAITWFKDIRENGPVELSGKSGRIVVEGSFLRFWPATVNDTGRYFCSLFNGTHNITGPNESLDVTPISEGCYSEEIAYKRIGVIGSSIVLRCPYMEEYKNNKEDLKWYKDCQENVHTGSSLLFQKLEKENAGYYTCKLSFEHSGVQYNITRTLALTLKEPAVTPNLIYPHQERIEVVLGENRTINCTAVAGNEKKPWMNLNWYFDNSPMSNCKQRQPVCKGPRRREDIWIHHSPRERDVTGRDETLEDDKEYDAYVLLLKSDETLLSAKEEQQFALELLPAILEEQFGYRLCIFERDVPPGGGSADNILFYINKCRRLIIILSKEYVDDEYSSTYELMTGLHQVLVERKIKPILIEFKPISNTKSLPESLQLVRRSKRTVKWKGSKSVFKHSYFWKKVRYLMPAKGGQPEKHSQHAMVESLTGVGNHVCKG